MLKRQRPMTPPPSSLDDPPSFLPDGPLRPTQPSLTADPSQPCSKRQRIRPPPLDGALRGWLESAGPHWESDDEEDWIEDAHGTFRSPLPSSTTADRYKDANSLLHELHVLNQHRLLLAHSHQDRRSDSSPRVPLPSAYTYTQDSPAGQRPAIWIDGPPCYCASSHLARDRPASCIDSTKEKGLVEEVQCVRRRYEDANRLLGSLFLLRRREVEEMTSSTHPAAGS